MSGNSDPTGQSPVISFVEAVTNVVVGYVVAVVTQIVVLPLFGVRLAIGENLVIGGVFTLISLVRGYALRRFFETRIRRWWRGSSLVRQGRGRAGVQIQRATGFARNLRDDPDRS